jgi:transposase-like protein
MKSQYRTFVNGRWRTEMQINLSEYYDEDIMSRIVWWREHDNMSWREIHSKIYLDTGYRVASTTLARWMSYERNGR